MPDNVKTLVQGEVTIRARDASNGNLVVTAAVAPGGTPSTDSRTFQRVAGAALRYEDSTPVDTETLDHPRFFEARDTVVFTPVDETTPDGSPDSNAFELRDELTVTII